MSKSKIIIPTECSQENILLTNLSLLQYPTKIDIEMFSNKAVFFNVIHFLFVIIDPEQTKKVRFYFLLSFLYLIYYLFNYNYNINNWKFLNHILKCIRNFMNNI